MTTRSKKRKVLVCDIDDSAILPVADPISISNLNS